MCACSAARIGPEVSAKRPTSRREGIPPTSGKASRQLQGLARVQGRGPVEDDAGRAGLDLEQASAIGRVLDKAMDLGDEGIDLSAVVATNLGEEARG